MAVEEWHRLCHRLVGRLKGLVPASNLPKPARRFQAIRIFFALLGGWSLKPGFRNPARKVHLEGSSTGLLEGRFPWSGGCHRIPRPEAPDF